MRSPSSPRKPPQFPVPRHQDRQSTTFPRHPSAQKGSCRWVLKRLPPAPCRQNSSSSRDTRAQHRWPGRMPLHRRYNSLWRSARKAARKSISDHAQVWMRIDTEAKWTILDAEVPAASGSSAAGSHQFSTQDAGSNLSNRNSKIFHLPVCPDYNRVSSRNIETFATPEAAKAAGYRMPCNCPPGNS